MKGALESDGPEFESLLYHLLDVGCWDESLNFAGPQFLHHLNSTMNALSIQHSEGPMR